MKKIMFIDYFVCSRLSSNEFIDSVKSVNKPLTDLSLVKFKSIKEVHGGNEGLETQIANKVDILQTPSSSDMPG